MAGHQSVTMKQEHEVAVLYCQKMRLQEEETLLLKEMKNYILYFKKHVISDLEHDIECKTYLYTSSTCIIIIPRALVQLLSA